MSDNKGYLYRIGDMVPGTRFRVCQHIGAGGMGTVYEVSTPPRGERYVIKVVHPYLMNGGHIGERLRREAMVLTEFEHPNIVHVVFAGETADDPPLPYCVMERLYGCPVSAALQRLGGTGFPLVPALEIAIELIWALTYAHDRGVVHRDVKPDNVFLHFDANGVRVTKLLDFGIVRILSEARATHGGFIGTLGCASPEQLRNEDPTVACDIYGAGITLYQMLTCHEPFGDLKDVQSIVEAHLHDSPTPPSAWRAIPPRLDALLLSMIAKNPASRPESSDVVYALEGILSTIRSDHRFDTHDSIEGWNAMESDLRAQSRWAQAPAITTAGAGTRQHAGQDSESSGRTCDLQEGACPAAVGALGLGVPSDHAIGCVSSGGPRLGTLVRGPNGDSGGGVPGSRLAEAVHPWCHTLNRVPIGPSGTVWLPSDSATSPRPAFTACSARTASGPECAEAICPLDIEARAHDRLRTLIVRGSVAGIVLSLILSWWVDRPQSIPATPAAGRDDEIPTDPGGGPSDLGGGCPADLGGSRPADQGGSAADLGGGTGADEFERQAGRGRLQASNAGGERATSAARPGSSAPVSAPSEPSVRRAPFRTSNAIGNTRPKVRAPGAEVLVSPDWGQLSTGGSLSYR